MRRVRQKGTAAEAAVGRALRALGFAYRKNVRALTGSPDFANRRRRWAVFVQGCFWHRHTGCRRATTPKANQDFWLEKFTRNRARDAAAVRALRRMGFRVVLVWECRVEVAAPRLSKVLEAGRVDVPETVDH
jgi:DNA mismatch endonuclease (patch repair protein)